MTTTTTRIMDTWKIEMGEPSPNPFTRQLPAGAKFLKADQQGLSAKAWFLVEPKQEKVERAFMLVGTGWRLEVTGDLPLIPLDSFQQGSGPFVWHLYEIPAGTTVRVIA
jgi:hypothetical protein